MNCPECGSIMYIVGSDVEEYKVFRNRECGGYGREYETKEVIVLEGEKPKIEVRRYDDGLQPFDKQQIIDDLTEIGIDTDRAQKISKRAENRVVEWQEENEVPVISWNKVAQMTREEIDDENKKQEYINSLSERFFQ